MKQRSEPTTRLRAFIRRLSSWRGPRRSRHDVEAQVAAELAIIAERRTAA